MSDAIEVMRRATEQLERLNNDAERRRAADVKLPNAIARRARSLGMTPQEGGIPLADVDAKIAHLDREERIGIKTALDRVGQIKRRPA